MHLVKPCVGQTWDVYLSSACPISPALTPAGDQSVNDRYICRLVLVLCTQSTDTAHY